MAHGSRKSPRGIRSRPPPSQHRRRAWRLPRPSRGAHRFLEGAPQVSPVRKRGDHARKEHPAPEVRHQKLLSRYALAIRRITKRWGRIPSYAPLVYAVARAFSSSAPVVDSKSFASCASYCLIPIHRSIRLKYNSPNSSEKSEPRVLEL